ncbi:MAG: DUF427 domain-containing protein [Alphaproteobacteria bacterium]
MSDAGKKAHHIKIDPEPASVRVELGGEVIAETSAAVVLREGSIPPVYYIPREDVRPEVLTATSRLTHCPFKGDASYWTLEAGGKTLENAVWSYQDPFDQVAAIKGHMAFYVDRVDSFIIGD